MQHVLELWRNFISLNWLDSLIIKVSKGSLVVMKREKPSKNLHKLTGDAVRGGVHKWVQVGIQRDTCKDTSSWLDEEICWVMSS